MHHSEASDLRSVDRQLLLALRGGESMGIGELTEILGVTATAVRQRVERLLELGLIEREKLVAGRGRPTFRYRLTVAGHQRAGANPSELADAMWHEILLLPETAVRDRLLAAVADRLGRRFANEVNVASQCDKVNETTLPSEVLESRFQKLSAVLASRQIDNEVSHSGELPVLDLGTCPYPSLTDFSDDRAMCRLEEKIFSEALGHPVYLSSCRLDGDACCQFSTTASGNTNQSST